MVNQDVGLDAQNESDNSDYSDKTTYPPKVAVDHLLVVDVYQPPATFASYVGHSIIGEHSAKRARLEVKI